jgi:hypothetical protein
MKTIRLLLIALLPVGLLSGCAGSPETPPETKMIGGEQHYFIKTTFGPCQHSRDWATRTLTIRSNEICKSGYVLVEQQTPITVDQLNPSPAARPKDRELIWQIKCRNVEPTKS